mgnify:CR=1 FL=1
MQEQIDVAKRPNLPAGDYWVNNKDNTFKKENEQNRPLQQEATAKKSGTLPGITIPMGRSGDVISPVPRGDSPLLRTGVSEPVRAVKPLEPTGIPGFLPPPGSFGTVEMAMAQGTANQGPASEQMQARCPAKACN